MADAIVTKNLSSWSKVAFGIGDGLPKKVEQQIQRTAATTTTRARRRMSALGGTGSRTAATIRSEQRRGGAVFKMGRSSTPFYLGREFGAQRGVTRRHTQSNLFGKGIVFEGRKAIPYRSATIFGSWTGNAFTVEPGKVSGRAFYPSVAEGIQQATKQIMRYNEEWARKLTAAGR